MWAAKDSIVTAKKIYPSCEGKGSGGWGRTNDGPVNSRLLLPLSYAGMVHRYVLTRLPRQDLDLRSRDSESRALTRLGYSAMQERAAGFDPATCALRMAKNRSAN